ncbi:hypothetical protein L1887_37811 [Cichorium endivia]|nr:hypothetical protein L1887_37811 [Cichorium endivia]
MKWRWKTDKCELLGFDAVEFLEVVRAGIPAGFAGVRRRLNGILSPEKQVVTQRDPMQNQQLLQVSFMESTGFVHGIRE